MAKAIVMVHEPTPVEEHVADDTRLLVDLEWVSAEHSPLDNHSVWVH